LRSSRSGCRDFDGCCGAVLPGCELLGVSASRLGSVGRDHGLGPAERRQGAAAMSERRSAEGEEAGRRSALSRVPGSTCGSGNRFLARERLSGSTRTPSFLVSCDDPCSSACRLSENGTGSATWSRPGQGTGSGVRRRGADVGGGIWRSPSVLHACSPVAPRRANSLGTTDSRCFKVLPEAGWPCAAMVVSAASAM